MMHNDIAKRAFEQIGTPFRLHGRSAGLCLDCVGLVAHAINQKSRHDLVPGDYTIRGLHKAQIKSFFGKPVFNEVQVASLQSGDIVAVNCSLRQSHLMIRVEEGWVHAHAGLGRIVFTPDPIAWPIWGAWRVKEN
jgi:cell wall-associated NlpC family hydrolase